MYAFGNVRSPIDGIPCPIALIFLQCRQLPLRIVRPGAATLTQSRPHWRSGLDSAGVCDDQERVYD